VRSKLPANIPRRRLRRRSLAAAALGLTLFIVPPVQAEPEPRVSAHTDRHTSISTDLSRYVASHQLWPLQNSQATQAQAPKRRSFVKRHPVWTGVLVGTGAGTALAAGVWGSEGAFVGFYTGAAAGALVGWLASR